MGQKSRLRSHLELREKISFSEEHKELFQFFRIQFQFQECIKKVCIITPLSFDKKYLRILYIDEESNKIL